jgi:hypothetical protein
MLKTVIRRIPRGPRVGWARGAVKSCTLATWMLALCVVITTGTGCDAGDSVAGPTVSCYKLMESDSDSGVWCAFGSTDEPAEASTCADEEDGASSGGCPLSDHDAALVGCCLTSLTISSYGAPTVMATNGNCYYSAEAAKSAMRSCPDAALSNGEVQTWSATP